MQHDRAHVAKLIDHTLLTPEATADDVLRLCKEAAELGVGAVCVNASMLPLPAGILPAGIAVAAVCGFPSGAHHAHIKAIEAKRAVDEGATEIDVVINLGRAKAGRWDDVAGGLAVVRAAVPKPTVLKAILETGLWSNEEIIAACHAADAAGVDFVKTSTGFHPCGGATVEAVRVMAETVGGRLGVKASGGIRTSDMALAMLDAGATRIGTSSTAAILAGL